MDRLVRCATSRSDSYSGSGRRTSKRFTPTLSHYSVILSRAELHEPLGIGSVDGHARLDSGHPWYAGVMDTPRPYGQHSAVEASLREAES